MTMDSVREFAPGGVHLSNRPKSLEGIPDWALEMAEVSESDESLPSAINGVNLVLNRVRLANFLASFADDNDIHDFLTLDVMAAAAELPLSSTGLTGSGARLAARPFRIWEYTWLYKGLGLSKGEAKVLDLGGAASHLTFLAALAGCHVTTIDINPEFIRAAKDCARALNLVHFAAHAGDMRDLSQLASEEFDVVICCSVLEHLTAADQELALQQMARVLKTGGRIGLTFDLGAGSPGSNEHLPPPHDPPFDPGEAVRRYQQGGLRRAGNPFTEKVTPGCLFHSESVTYTVASLFLTKPGNTRSVEISVPRCVRGGKRSTGSLRIAELLPRVYREAASWSRDVEDQLQLAMLQEVAAERLAALLAKEDAITELKKAAEDRLATIVEEEQVIAHLHLEIEALRAEVLAKENAISELKAAADERLTALIEKEHVIEGLAEGIEMLQSRLQAASKKVSTNVSPSPLDADQCGDSTLDRCAATEPYPNCSNDRSGMADSVSVHGESPSQASLDPER